MRASKSDSPESILKTGHFFGGVWSNLGDPPTVVVNKFTQEPIAELPWAKAEQMEQAIEAAVLGFASYRTWSAGKRASALERLHRALEARRSEFVALIVAEAGKPWDYARIEVERGLMTVALAAQEALRWAGEVVPIDSGAGEGKTAFTQRFPLGPIAAIVPFNFPLNLALHKLAPALAVGCSVVLKPPPQAPLTALALAGLCEEAGFPPGVVNVLHCSVEVAQALIHDPRLKMLSFTGSSRVGWALKAQSGRKKTLLELGGNAAVIVDEHTDLDQVASQVALGANFYAGQVCVSIQRVYVLECHYGDFVERLVQAIKKLAIGNPKHEGIVLGPLIDQSNLERVAGWVKEARQQGAECLVGGETWSQKHHIYAPTLLTHTQPHMKVVAEEIFGPVAIIEAVPDFEAALEAVNASEFGLQVGIFTNRIDHMRLAHARLEVGAVLINQGPGFRHEAMPYGGVKASGFGREGIRYAMEAMSEPRLLIY